MCGTELFESGSHLASAFSLPGQKKSKPKSKSGRVRLHEMDHWCCSIVGTCLKHEDLLAVARKRNITMDADVKMFDVHGFFVGEAGKDGEISKHLEKMLNDRYAGLVRKVSRIRDESELVEFWNSSVNNGLVAGAYWAMLSHAHVPAELRNRIFGEVHMMSHLMGGSTRKIVGAAAELQSRVEELEKRLRRSATHAEETLAERDAEIARLTEALAEARAQADRASSRERRSEHAVTGRASKQVLKRERALISARTKTRELEAELATTNERLQAFFMLHKNSRQHAAPAVRKPGDFTAPLGLCGKAVLYLGGRKGATSHLQKEAASVNVELLYHDGGLEQSVQMIGELVHKCDAVICPVTCINHQACLKAKRLCKRLNKPFMPVNSTGRATFSRALSDLADRLTAAG